MFKSLKTLATQAAPMQVQFTIQERLPFFVQGHCELNCEFEVEKRADYYLLSSTVQGNIPIVCQTCLEEFDYAYHQNHELAICTDELRAEKLMSSLDCIVNPMDEIDLLAIVTDDLHLFCPERHVDSMDCQLITAETNT